MERAAPLLIIDKGGDEIDGDFSDASGRALVISVTILDADADADAERVREAKKFGSRIHLATECAEKCSAPPVRKRPM